MAENRKALLMILDGWGLGDKSKSDVIASTSTPYMDALMSKYPNSQLHAAGEYVGLPDGQMGNSEVGHLNIGAGRVVNQDLVRINLAVKDESINTNPQLIKAFAYAKENNSKLHLVGLLGDGGVHSLSSHAVALCDAAAAYGLKDVFVHALTDGRDTDPKSGLNFLKEFVDATEKKGTAKIATMIGRYFGMDRDNNWERMKLAYDLYTKADGKQTTDVVKAMEESYAEGITDEFVKPVVVVDQNGEPLAKIEEKDVVICFNYRTDRLRQMTTMFSQEDIADHGLKTMDVQWYTMTCYNANFKGVNVIYDKDNLKKTLGEVVAQAGKKQIRIAETEKYAHVTFFFSGGREDEFEGESRLLVASPKVATYDLQPEMSAPQVADKITAELKAQSADFVCLNFANGDMVGHTGIYSAIEKAIQTVDSCVEQVVEEAKANGYDVIIIADHGNADFAVNPDGSPNTAHSLNPVPCIWVTENKGSLKNGKLADVAPTILKIMNIEQPEEMTGKSLID